MKILKSHSIDSNHNIILYEWRGQSEKRIKNLKFYSNEKLVWEAELGTSTYSDCYTEFQIQNGKLFANTFSCYLNEIDLITGKVISSEFTK